MYKIEKQPIYIQAGVAAAMMFFGVTVLRSWIMSGILCFFAILLLKDVYEMFNAEYVVAETALQYKVKDKVKWEIKWMDLDMVTRTKKNARWVVVSDGTEFKMLKHTITNFKDLMEDVLRHGAVNKELKIHETISEYVDMNLQLDDMGRIKKKSREKLLDKAESDES